MQLIELGKTLSNKTCYLSLALLIAWSSKNLYGYEMVNKLTTPFADPLSTQPPIIDAMHQQTILCPTTDSITAPLSLSRAVDLALCHNPQIKSAWVAIKIQAAALGEARAAYLPTLTASTSRTKNVITYPSSQSSLDNNVTSTTAYGNFNWRLLDFGGRDANRRSANALLSAALSSHQATLQKILAGVIGAYFDTQTALATWQTKSQNEVLLQAILNSARRREARGVGAQTDTMQAETALARMTLEKTRAKAAYQKAQATLLYNLGLPAQSKLTLSNNIADKNEPIRQDLDAWLVEIQARHPALLAARQQVVSAQEKITVTTSEGLPTLDFSSAYYRNGQPNQSLAPNSNETLTGVTLTIPLFEGFVRTYKVRGAQALLEQKKAELLDTEHQILLDVIKTHAEALTALDNLSAAQKYLESAQLALDSIQRKFDKGTADILAVLNAQVGLSDAQQEHIRCLTEWRAAKLKLLAQAGVFEVANIQAD